MAELKHCPFCGSPAEIHYAEFPSEFLAQGERVPKDARVIREWRKPGEKRWHVEFRRTAYVPRCTDSACVGRSHKMFKTKQEAAKAWNRRADDG